MNIFIIQNQIGYKIMIMDQIDDNLITDKKCRDGSSGTSKW